MSANAAHRMPGHRVLIDWSKACLQPKFAHKYGGLPSNGARLPRCTGCGNHLHLLLQIDLADPSLEYLRIDLLDYLFVLTCLNCLSYLDASYYRIEDRGKVIVLLEEEPGPCVADYPHPLEECHAAYRPLRDEEYPQTERDLDRLLEQKAKHQLGGSPIWIQREEHLHCPQCAKAMRFIAMVDSDLHLDANGFRDRGHIFGDAGILYLFVCRTCGVLASTAQTF